MTSKKKPNFDLTKDGLLKFMYENEDGSYKVEPPTEQQLAEVLPWLVDTLIRWSADNGYGRYGGHILTGALAALSKEQVDIKLVKSDGRDYNGFDRDGFNHRGYDQHGYDRDGYDSDGRDKTGYNKAGFDYYGYDRFGFDRHGRNKNGDTREQVVTKQVKGWTPEYAKVMVELLTAKEAPAEPEPAKAA